MNEPATIVVSRKIERNKIWYRVKTYKYVYLLMLPALITVLLFQYLPFCGIIMAFKKFDIVKGLWRSDWVGFDNFVQVFSTPKFLSAIKNTLVYSITLLIGNSFFPIILALLINELKNSKFKKVVQTISYMPYFLSWITVAGLFYGFFATEGTYNSLMKYFIGNSYKSVNILLDAKNFLGIIFCSAMWKNVGWSSVIYLAAIAGIDPTFYEAAAIDGCGKLKQTFHITIPCISTTIIIVLIMSMGSLVTSSFDQIYGFQNLYTQEQTEVINTLIYRNGIMGGEYSTTTAFGLAQGFVSLMLVFCSNVIAKKVSNISVF